MKKVRPACLPVFLLIFSIITTAGATSPAEETEGDSGTLNKIGDGEESFSLAWKIAYRGTDIGYSISRFSFVPAVDPKKGGADGGSHGFMVEEGIKRFDLDLRVIKISYVENTATTWDGSGLIVSFNSTIDINGSVEKRHFRRTKEGTGILKIVKGDKVRKVSRTADEFDFTSGDLCLKGFNDGSGDVTYRIMSLADGKLGTLSYTFIGRETIAGTNGVEECSKIDIVGKKGDGTILIDDMGIALYFKVDFPLGDFSFTPVGLPEAEAAISN